MRGTPFDFYFPKKLYTMEKGLLLLLFHFLFVPQLAVSFGSLGRAEHFYRSYKDLC